MAKTTEHAWRDWWLAGRPMSALACVWLTTAGHTMNFREMEAARGWIAAEGYSLHSIYLYAIALTLLAGPALVRRFSSRALTELGLTLLLAGSLVNGFFLHAPMRDLLIGRLVAGVGAGLVIAACPRLLPASWESAAVWAGILFPAMGPAVVSGASFLYGWSSWEGGFLFEGALALVGLALIVSMPDASEPPAPEASGSLAFLPWFGLANWAIWFVQHWGQLDGWLEGRRSAFAMVVGASCLAVALTLIWPRLDTPALRSNWPRLLLIAYAGLVQYFNVSDMGVYGGSLLNFSVWQRAWLIWSISYGAAAALLVGRLAWAGRSPGLPGALVGLLVLAGGMAMALAQTLAWPFWLPLNSLDLHWFPAPQHWQLAPGRFLMGFGSAFVLFSMNTLASTDPAREERLRPLLPVAQFLGGALGIGILTTYLLFGQQVQYSYAADRGYIQAAESNERRHQLRDELHRAGSPSADREAQTLLFRSVKYQAANLVFADIYAGFMLTSLALAALVLALIGWEYARGKQFGRHWMGWLIGTQDQRAEEAADTAA